MGETMKTYLNLMPQGLQRRELIRARVRQWSIVWVVAGALAVTVGSIQWTRLGSARSRVLGLQKEYAPVETLQKDNTSIRSQIEELQQREKITLEIADERPVLTLLGSVSRAARECEGNVCVQKLSLKPARAAGGSRRLNSAETDVQRRLTLNGLGVDNLSVARFVAALRDTGVFSQVDLKSTEATTVNTVQARTYHLECTF